MLGSESIFATILGVWKIAGEPDARGIVRRTTSAGRSLLDSRSGQIDVSAWHEGSLWNLERGEEIARDLLPRFSGLSLVQDHLELHGTIDKNSISGQMTVACAPGIGKGTWQVKKS